MKNNSIFKKILNIDVFVASIMLIILVALTFAGVIWRRIFSNPFTWMEEVQLACLVWIVFPAGSAAFRSGSHVGIEFIVDRLPKNIQFIVEKCIDLVVLFVLSYLFIQSLGFVNLFFKSGRATSILNIPYALIYGIAPVSIIAMIINHFYAKYVMKIV